MVPEVRVIGRPRGLFPLNTLSKNGTSKNKVLC